MKTSVFILETKYFILMNSTLLVYTREAYTVFLSFSFVKMLCYFFVLFVNLLVQL